MAKQFVNVCGCTDELRELLTKNDYLVNELNETDFMSAFSNRHTLKTDSIIPYLVKITANSLRVRTGPGLEYGIVTYVSKNEVYTIIEERGTWGRLKSGAGWISISPSYVDRLR